MTKWGTVYSQEAAALDTAIAAARTAPGQFRVNPRVGCVLLDQRGAQLAVGAHHGPGSAHAEVVALQALPAGMRPHTAVVTLEPCAHTGRTGPCATALIDAGIQRVVIGMAEVNPVAMGGIAALQRAGIDVEVTGLGREVDPGWFTAVALGRPQVTIKMGCSLDGRVAAADGTSRWITSAESRADAHRLRAASDCVLAGTGTVLTDNAHLAVRRDGQVLPRPLQPLRAVLGRRAIPAAARVNDDVADTVFLDTQDIPQALNTLWHKGIRRVLVEGGPRINGAFLRAGLVDLLVCYLAPVLLGDGLPAIVGAGVETMSQALRWRLTDVMPLGPDIRIMAQPLLDKEN